MILYDFDYSYVTRTGDLVLKDVTLEEMTEITNLIGLLNSKRLQNNAS
jgi:hypothetical protein